MPKITISTNNGASFLKEGDLKHKEEITILDAGKWTKSKKFTKEDGTPTEQFEITVRLPNGEDRTVTFSWTTLKNLAPVFGEDSEDWIGKKVRAWRTASTKAKSGFTWVFAPVEWIRDDMGVWCNADGEPLDFDSIV